MAENEGSGEHEHEARDGDEKDGDRLPQKRRHVVTCLRKPSNSGSAGQGQQNAPEIPPVERH